MYSELGDYQNDLIITSAEDFAVCPIPVVFFQLNGFHGDIDSEGLEDLLAPWEFLPWNCWSLGTCIKIWHLNCKKIWKMVKERQASPEIVRRLKLLTDVLNF